MDDPYDRLADMDPEKLEVLVDHADTLEELAEAREDNSINRREFAKAAGALGLGGLLGGGGAAAAIRPASAEASTSDSYGDAGTPGDPIDVFADGVNIYDGANNQIGSLDETGLDIPSVSTEDLVTADQPVRDVRDYGAEGDGATDDTAAIQSALDDGGIIYIPHSHTFRGDGLSSPSAEAVAVVGRGIIKMRDGDNASDWVLDVAGDESLVRGITIDGNGGETANTGRNEGLHVSGANSDVEAVTAIDTKTGTVANAFMTDAPGVVFRGCTARNAGYGGFKTFHSAAFIGCRSIDFQTKGIVANSDISGTVKVSNCYIESTVSNDGQNGILADTGSGTIDMLTVDGTEVRGSLSGGQVKAENVDMVSVRGSDFRAGNELTLSGATTIELKGCYADGMVRIGADKHLIEGGEILGQLRVQQGDHVTVKDVNLTGNIDGVIRYESTSTKLNVEGCRFDIGAGNRVFQMPNGMTAGMVSIDDARWGMVSGDLSTGVDSRDKKIIVDGLLGELKGGIDLSGLTSPETGTKALASGATATNANSVFRRDSSGDWIRLDGGETVAP